MDLNDDVEGDELKDGGMVSEESQQKAVFDIHNLSEDPAKSDGHVKKQWLAVRQVAGAESKKFRIGSRPHNSKLDPSIPVQLRDADSLNLTNDSVDGATSAHQLLPTLDESPEVWEGNAGEILDFRFPQLLDIVSKEGQDGDSKFPSSLHQNIDIISMEDIVEGLGINHFFQGATLEEPWECLHETQFKELLVVEVPAFPLQIVLLVKMCAFQFALKSIRHFRAVVGQAGNSDHPFLLDSQMLEAICLCGLGHYSSAETLLDKCFTTSVDARLHGEQRMIDFRHDVLKAKGELSELKQDYERAEELYLQAVEPWMQQGETDHPSVIKAQMHFARVRWKTGMMNDSLNHVSSV